MGDVTNSDENDGCDGDEDEDDEDDGRAFPARSKFAEEVRMAEENHRGVSDDGKIQDERAQDDCGLENSDETLATDFCQSGNGLSECASGNTVAVVGEASFANGVVAVGMSALVHFLVALASNTSVVGRVGVNATQPVEGSTNEAVSVLGADVVVAAALEGDLRDEKLVGVFVGFIVGHSVSFAGGSQVHHGACRRALRAESISSGKLGESCVDLRIHRAVHCAVHRSVHCRIHSLIRIHRSIQ